MFKKMKMTLTAVAVLTVVALFGATPEAEASSYQTKAVTEAKKNLGVKYLWGGTTPRGFDCSGFVKYSYAKAGKTLPRTAAEMHRKGKAVNQSAMKPGDLMFFAQSKASRPSHVALYLGNGKMIHAETYYKKVVVGSINDRYWKPRFVGAKRI